ncbi:MAG: hypothetical protein K8R02_03080 [Anaerohalosphaeraceae bacterium]|nr:hypothetical protein [Anaerohalosphaeraceae bacterium]
MKKLTKKQLIVIGELFESGGDEAGVAKKYKVSNKLMRQWLKQKEFQEELAYKFASANRQSRLLLAKYIPLAAAKLVELCASEKEETARKACLDILTIHLPKNISQKNEDKSVEQESEGLSSNLSSKLLAVLADSK